jgi:hypothetical protein
MKGGRNMSMIPTAIAGFHGAPLVWGGLADNAA